MSKRNRERQFLKRRRGFSLAEIALGIVIMGVIIGAVLAFGGDLKKAATKLNSTESILNLTTSAMSCMERKGFNNFENITIDFMREEGCVPEGFTGIGVNPYGGDYSIGPDSSDNTLLVVTLTNVPASSCDELKSFFSQRVERSNCNTGDGTFTAVFR
jgi:Tfp pilus assembly protein FimT